jgi:GWxTD domain-containing protein
MKKIIFLFVIICSGMIFGQLENKDNLNPSKVKYYQDFMNFYGDNEKTRLDVFIKVPYSEVQFIKTGNGYEAAYTVTVSVYAEDKETMITEKIWNEKITTFGFPQTTAEENFKLSYKSINLLPGKYFIHTGLLDKDSREEFSSENFFTIRNLNDKPSISDIMLIAQKNVVEGSSKIVPNVSREVIVDKDGIPIFFELYADSSQQITLEYSIADIDNKVQFQDTSKIQLKPGSNQLFHTIDKFNLSLGKYLLNVNVRDENGEQICFATKSFVSRWSGVPKSITDLDKAIAQLVYIANPSELNNIKDAKTNEEKTKNFMSFWKSKDPTPDTDDNRIFEEYYKRVAYANEHFSNYSEGWRSDRGMVLILLGIPDNIDRHPFEYYSKPYEVWQYYDLNRSFTFLDETGFGDYRLTTPLSGDLYRFRYK